MLVSVHGAGQQWVSFMRRGSVLVSLGWKHWRPDFYRQAAVAAGVSFRGVLISDPQPNHEAPLVQAVESGQVNVRGAGSASLPELLAKWSDVRMPMRAFVNELCSVWPDRCSGDSPHGR